MFLTNEELKLLMAAMVEKIRLADDGSTQMSAEDRLEIQIGQAECRAIYRKLEEEWKARGSK